MMSRHREAFSRWRSREAQHAYFEIESPDCDHSMSDDVGLNNMALSISEVTSTSPKSL
jgi:hypothetical protein